MPRQIHCIPDSTRWARQEYRPFPAISFLFLRSPAYHCAPLCAPPPWYVVTYGASLRVFIHVAVPLEVQRSNYAMTIASYDERPLAPEWPHFSSDSRLEWGILGSVLAIPNGQELMPCHPRPRKSLSANRFSIEKVRRKAKSPL